MIKKEEESVAGDYNTVTTTNHELPSQIGYEVIKNILPIGFIMIYYDT